MPRSAKWMGLVIGCMVLSTPVWAQDPAQEARNQKLVMDWYREVIAFGHVDLASKYMAGDYIEHDPNLAGGMKEFVAFHGKNAPTPIQAALPVKPVQAFAKGDYVIIAWEHDDKDPKTGSSYKYITYDITRVKNGKIQEHWDSLRKN